MIDTLTKANRLVLAAQWGEAANMEVMLVVVVCGWRWRFRVCVVDGKNEEITRVYKKSFPAILFPILSSKDGVISVRGSPLEQI